MSEPGQNEAARVLVADDDPSIRQLVCTIVRREGLVVDAVADGQDAIEAIEAHEYAIILLDLMMPRLDGFGVIEYLKEHPPAHKPVILVISAYTDQAVQRVDSDIVAGVLRKPFEIADIGNIIKLCVRGFDEELQRQLMNARDQSIRTFAAQRFEGSEN